MPGNRWGDDDWTDESDRPTPTVVVWFRVYCAALVLMYVAAAAFSVFMMTAPDDPKGPSGFNAVFGVVLLVVSLACLVGSALPFVLPRRPWVWVYDLVVIGIGLTSGCTLLPCVFLLIYWLKPDAKAYFGRS